MKQINFDKLSRPLRVLAIFAAIGGLGSIVAVIALFAAVLSPQPVSILQSIAPLGLIGVTLLLLHILSLRIDDSDYHDE